MVVKYLVVCLDLDKGHYILKHTTLGLNLFHIFTPKCSSNGSECSTKWDPLGKKRAKLTLSFWIWIYQQHQGAKKGQKKISEQIGKKSNQ